MQPNIQDYACQSMRWHCVLLKFNDEIRDLLDLADLHPGQLTRHEANIARSEKTLGERASDDDHFVHRFI